MTAKFTNDDNDGNNGNFDDNDDKNDQKAYKSYDYHLANTNSCKFPTKSLPTSPSYFL